MKKVFSLLALVLMLASCGTESIEEQLIGKWKPVEDDGRVLEFTTDGYYNLFVGDMNIFQDIEGYGRIKYQIEPNGKKYTLNLMDEKLTQEFVKGELEVLSADKIAVAFYQNNGELNVKEEYVRIVE